MRTIVGRRRDCDQVCSLGGCKGVWLVSRWSRGDGGRNLDALGESGEARVAVRCVACGGAAPALVARAHFSVLGVRKPAAFQ